MATLQRGSTGTDVTRTEIRLKELKLYDKGIDDSFGPGLEAAVKAFQQKNGLPATGIVDDATRAALFRDPSPSLAAMQGKPLAFRCLALTAGFETGTGVPDCFCGLAGSFDGQGVSFGVLQWNLGQGTLQPMLQRLNQQHPQTVKAAFGASYDAFCGVLSKGKTDQLAWANTIQDAGHRVQEPWKSAFRALGRTQECQDAQVAGAADRYATGLKMCEEYGLWSERAAALMFDIVVQNGSIKAETKQQILADFKAIPATASKEDQEVQRMRIVARRRAAAANPKFSADVLSRKLTCAEGVGVVHGAGYDLERQFGIRLVPFQA
ncbi:MAG TPA: peptidoglycan-binding domain-containing protein [Longimicrobium sp.]|nr:peptidoglycan-binding domain-containing protein [Longimicrobium sp.]